MIQHRVSLEEANAWAPWNAFSSAWPALCVLADTPSAAILAEILPTIERYVVVLYDRGSSEDDVNRADWSSSRRKEGRSRRFHQPGPSGLQG